MTLNPGYVFAFLAMLFYSHEVCAQEKKLRVYERRFQFSLFPGISTNGVASGFYFNKYSLNLFGGLSAGNRYLELGLLTNSHFQSSTGIQLAGLANISGTNAYVNLTLWEERALIHDDFEVNNHGIQVAGILNYVLNHSKGIQIAGAFNHTGGNFSGLQLAGIGNSVGGYSLGVQLAGLYNLSKESVAGWQVSMLFNYTDASLSGSQFGLINKARIMPGRHSTPPTRIKSLQIGLINFSKEMDGTQIGLINFGGATRGKQIGLLNFFERIGSKENTRMGTPIGLLNFGSRGSYFKLSFNEIFPINAEYTTGNCLNCTWTPSGMPYTGRNRKFNQNALIVGYDRRADTWGYGWGFQKVLYNKASIVPGPANEKRLIMYGIKFIQLNREMELERKLNLVTKVNFDWGKRYKFLHWQAGVSLNYLLTEPSADDEEFEIRSVVFDAGRLRSFAGRIWPGYSIGLKL